MCGVSVQVGAGAIPLEAVPPRLAADAARWVELMTTVALNTACSSRGSLNPFITQDHLPSSVKVSGSLRLSDRSAGS